MKLTDLYEGAGFSVAENKKFSNFLRSLENELPHAARYKSFDFDATSKNVWWVTQESDEDDNDEVADIIAKALHDDGYEGWTVNVVLRDDYRGEDSPWSTSKS